MNVKEAVRTAKEYVAELYADEPASHVGVEEVVFDEPDNAWKVTVGFFRPWDEKLGLSRSWMRPLKVNAPYGRDVRSRSYKSMTALAKSSH